jgi:uracil-DNA glycosylase
VPDEAVLDPDVEVWAQNPGANEVAGERVLHYQGDGVAVLERGAPAPLIGATGYQVDHKCLPLAGLERGRNVRMSNVVRCRMGDPKTGRGTNTMPPLHSNHPPMRDIIRFCQRAHYKPTQAKTVVALGEYALWAATGEQGIEEWRGWVLPYRPEHTANTAGRAPHKHIYTPTTDDCVVLAHYHPAFVFRAPWEKPTLIQDWRKVGWVMERSWPKPMPPIERKPSVLWPIVSGFDTEYRPDTRELIRWSLAYEQDDGLCVRVVEADYGQPRILWHKRPTVYSHNWVADMPYLWWLGAPKETQLEDTMYMHHVLYSDLAHTLDYVGSMYQRINRHKHLEYVNPIEYSAGDAVAALDAGELLLGRSLARDPQSMRVYREFMMPNLPMLSRYEQGSGYALNQGRVKASLEALNRAKDAAQRKAWAASGWPLNLGSPQQVAHQLFDVERVR